MCLVPSHLSNMTNCPSTMAGVKRYYRRIGKDVRCVAFVGDGCAADVGFQSLSGAAERNENIIFITYDNEGYMNTGIQRSGLTPHLDNSTTTPKGEKSIGNPRIKKPMPEIAMAHGIPYVATASVGLIPDLQRKVKKALSIKGPKYLQIHVPCPLGWQYAPQQSTSIAKLAVDCGLYPLIEYDNGKLSGVRSITPKPVEEYLKAQGRFKHLLNNPDAIKAVQAVADANIAKYGLKMDTTSAPSA
jgi:pyruvate ferredoxin oxidoreductase beta subunit